MRWQISLAPVAAIKFREVAREVCSPYGSLLDSSSYEHHLHRQDYPVNLRESLKLIQNAEPLFGIAFYERFFGTHPEIERYFHDTPMHRQSTILTVQLLVVESYYTLGSRSAETYLHLLGTRHRDLGIPEKVYPHFRDVLLDELAHFHGTKWSDHLHGEWRNAIESSIEKMLDGYRERFHV